MTLYSKFTIALKRIYNIYQVMTKDCWGVSTGAMWDPLYYILTTKNKYDKLKIQ